MNRPMDDTSAALLEAAHRVLKEHGAAAMTVRRIASEAGYSTMNVYSRFGGKDGVLDEMYVDGFTRLRSALESQPTTDNVQDDVRLLAASYRSFALANPAYYDIMFSRSVPGFKPSPQAVQFSLDALSTMAQRIRTAQANGEIVSGPGCDPISITAWLWATIHGLVSLEIEGLGDELVTWESVFANGMHCAVAGLHPSVELLPAL